MFFRQVIIVCIIAFYLFLGYDSLFPQKTYVYEEITKENHNQITYTVENHPKAIIVKCKTKDHVITSETTNDFLLKSCALKSKKEDFSYQLQRDHNILSLEAFINGKFVKKQYCVNNDLWVQDFTFDLKPFIMNANEKKIHFFAINPQNLSLDKMIAKKENVEKIHVNGQDFDAQKVYLSYAGLKSMLWHATAWFDTANSKLIMYKCDDGPNSPILTQITLQKN
jgi:hypothetical protein